MKRRELAWCLRSLSLSPSAHSDGHPGRHMHLRMPITKTSVSTAPHTGESREIYTRHASVSPFLHLLSLCTPVRIPTQVRPGVPSDLYANPSICAGTYTHVQWSVCVQSCPIVCWSVRLVLFFLPSPLMKSLNTFRQTAAEGGRPFFGGSPSASALDETSTVTSAPD